MARLQKSGSTIGTACAVLLASCLIAQTSAQSPNFTAVVRNASAQVADALAGRTSTVEIRLAAGTYNATEPIVINLSNATRPITVRVTGVTANATVLSCSGRPIRALQIINAGATFISALTIQNCGTNNTNSSGGSTFISGTGNVTISSAVFSGNRVRRLTNSSEGPTGGAVYIEAPSRTNRSSATILTIRDSAFVDNSATRGGAVAISSIDATITLDNCDFVGNAALRGGAAEVEDTVGNVNIIETDFVGNQGSLDGGAVRLSKIVGAFTVNNTNFAENTVNRQLGGGLLVQGASGNGFVLNSTFFANDAQVGSGIAVQDSPFLRLVMTNNTYAGNTCGNSGCGFYTNGGTVSITDSTFLDNAAGFAGAGMVAFNNTAVQITSSVFANNSASRGSGVEVRVFGGSIRIIDVDFIRNSASGDGGGLLVFGRVSPLQITDTDFVGNSAGFNGGGSIITLEGGGASLQFSNVTWDSNQAGGGGGGLFMLDGDNTQMTVSRSTFNENTARSGAGVQFERFQGTVNIGNTTFSTNVADSNGGGFWAVDTGARFTFNGCVFQDNEATDRCSAAGIVRGSPALVVNTVFTNNANQANATDGECMTLEYVAPPQPAQSPPPPPQPQPAGRKLRAIRARKAIEVPVFA